MTRAPSRNGAVKDLNKKTTGKDMGPKGKATKSSPKKAPKKSKTPPSSPGSNASRSGSPGEKEQRNRRSLRLGNSTIVDFKVLSSRGRDYLFPSPNSLPPEFRISVKKGFSVRQTFPTYDDLMRFTKVYEQEHHVRLNASMITPQDRLSGMGDWDYYRFVTFWCNFDPSIRHNSGYTPIDERYCPFFVRVAGNSKRKCLCVEEVSDKGHEHSTGVPGSILSAPPLPATVDCRDLPSRPASVPGSRKGRSEKISNTTRAPRQKNGRVVKHKKRNVLQKKSRSKRPPETLTSENVLSSTLQSDPVGVDVNSENSASNIVEGNSAPTEKVIRRPKHSNLNSHLISSRAARTVPKKLLTDECLKCSLCDHLCRSTDELVGHTWLRHQILTETWDLY